MHSFRQSQANHDASGRERERERESSGRFSLTECPRHTILPPPTMLLAPPKPLNMAPLAAPPPPLSQVGIMDTPPWAFCLKAAHAMHFLAPHC